MKENLIDKLKKINALIERGSTEGERVAAKIQFDKIIKKYELTEDDLLEIVKREYCFTFGNMAEYIVLVNIVGVVLGVPHNKTNMYSYSGTKGRRKTYNKLTKLEFIEISAMYEYFRRHMKAQRKEVTEKAKLMGRYVGMSEQKSLKNTQEVFAWEYVRKSNIYASDPNGTSIKVQTPINNEYFNAIEGGKYFTQLNSDSRILEHSINI